MEALSLNLIDRWVKQRETFEKFTRDFPTANKKSQEYFISSRSLDLLAVSEELTEALRQCGLEVACGRYYSIESGYPLLPEDAERLMAGHKVDLIDSLTGYTEFN